MKHARRAIAALLAVVVVLGVHDFARAEDWPMWRHDALHASATSEELPRDLRLQWVLELPTPQPCWPFTQYKLQFDLSYEPVVAGDAIFVPSMARDSVTAYDTKDGTRKWRFYADGPVRFAPIVAGGKVYFVSDDSYLYCLDAATGALRWKFRGGPSERKLLGNGRLISVWPARGAPVLYDGAIYFAASIWPLMGTFIHALDAETGKVIWTNSGSGSDFILQPHGSPAFAGVAPQGYLVATEDALLVAGGRSIPAVYDRHTGEFLRFETNTKLGGYAVVAGKDWFLNDGYLYRTEDESRLLSLNATVAADGVLIGATDDGGLRAYSTDLKWEDYTDRRGETQKRATAPVRWELGGEYRFEKVYLRAGSRLYAGRKDGFIAAVELPRAPGDAKQAASELPQPTVSWQTTVAGEPWSVLAANGKLFVVTTDGRIYCFGADDVKATIHRRQSTPERADRDDAWSRRATQILEATGVREGYGLVLGLGTGRLIEELLRQSKLRLIGLDPDAGKVAALRQQFDAQGLYGDRVALLAGDLDSIPMPPYLASLIVSEDLSAAGQGRSEAFVEHVFAALHPYGGVAAFRADAEWRTSLAQRVEEAELPGAVVKEAGDLWLLQRPGAVPGSAPWTHQYGDVANTVCSKDGLVKAPLGLLWFGGPSHLDVLPRHGHGPAEQVIGGRLFIEGIRVMSARDVYTGRLLWRKELPYLDTFGRYYNETYNPDPYDRSYNEVHIPGANASGSNYVATADRVYLAQGQECLVLDAATGETLATFRFPPAPGAAARYWGYVGVYDDLLIAGAAPLDVAARDGDVSVDLNQPFATGSEYLVVMNRFTGQVLWERKAAYQFRHNTIIAGSGKLFCIDGLSKAKMDLLRRRGLENEAEPALLALDLRTGDEVWRVREGVFGTWLGYSTEHDVLLQAGSESSDRAEDEVGAGMRAYTGADGTLLWKSDRSYYGPPILYHDRIITQPGYGTQAATPANAFSLLTGEVVMRDHPLTGEKVPWGWIRLYGCNTAIGSEHLLTFRSASAAYSELWTGQGLTSLGGFKAGCTSNLVVADGVLNAPDYTRTCTCSYQNQTSLALYPVPAEDLQGAGAESWSFNYLPAPAVPTPVKRVGINLGAPGDRVAEDGLLWVEFPSVGGPSPDIPVYVEATRPQFFRSHMSQVAKDQTGAPSWVAASGVEGLTAITIWPFLLPSGETDGDEVKAFERNAGTSQLPSRPVVAVGDRTIPWRYTVRLHFAEPREATPGARVFDIFVQGRKAREGFDIVKEAGGAWRPVVVEVKGVAVETALKIEFRPSTPGASRPPLLCGLELLAEE
jgi:outer membrane protein assembly factor BamB